jgi:hypothetical protein
MPLAMRCSDADSAVAEVGHVLATARTWPSEKAKRNRFTVTLFGRTIAGKSTIREQ